MAPIDDKQKFLDDIDDYVARRFSSPGKNGNPIDDYVKHRFAGVKPEGDKEPEYEGGLTSVAKRFASGIIGTGEFAAKALGAEFKGMAEDQAKRTQEAIRDIYKLAGREPPGDNLDDYRGGTYGARAVGAVAETIGDILGNINQSNTIQSGFKKDNRWDEVPFRDIISDPSKAADYFTDASEGFLYDLPQGVGNAASFIAAARLAPKQAFGRAGAGISELTAGILGRAGATRAAQTLGSQAAKDIIASGLQYGSTMGPLQPLVNAGTMVDELRSQGKSDSEIRDIMHSMAAEELPYDLAFGALTGNAFTGQFGRLPGLNSSTAKKILANLLGVPVESAGGYFSNAMQMRVANKYMGKPYGTWDNPTLEEDKAGQLGALAGIPFSGYGVYRGVREGQARDRAENARKAPYKNISEIIGKVVTDDDGNTNYTGDSVYGKFREGTQEHLDKYGEAGRQSYRDAVNEGNLRELARREAVPDNVFDTIMRVADEEGVPRERLLATVIAESNGNQDEISPVGAIGVTQLMPETAQALGVDPYDLEQNILGGALYLKQMYDATGDWTLAHAAYNAGPNAVKRYGGVPPYAETQNYVDRINGLVGDIPSPESNEQRGNIFGTENYDMPLWGDPNVSSLKNGWNEILPQIGGVLKSMGFDPVITSGGRTQEHQMSINPSAPNSYHIIRDEGGDAIDISLAENGVSAEDAQRVKEYFENSGLFKEVLYHDAGSGLHLHLGGLNTEALSKGRDIQTRADEIYANKKRGLDANAPSWSDYVKAASKPKESTQETEPEKPRQISLDDAIFSDFANDRLAKAVEDKDVDTIQFFSGMFEDDGTFANTRKNRARIQQRYGDEVTQFAETRANTSETAQPAQSQTQPQANPQPKQSQTATPAQKPQSSKYLRNDPVIQAGNKFLEELNAAGKKENTATAFQLSAAIQQGDATEIKNILKQNGRENLIQQVQQESQAQPQEAPVKQNTTPENKLTQPQPAQETPQPQEQSEQVKQKNKNAPKTGLEKAIAKAHSNLAKGRSKEAVGKRAAVGRALTFIADNYGVEIPQVEREALREKGDAKTIEKWREQLMYLGHLPPKHAKGKQAQPAKPAQQEQTQTPQETQQQPSLMERARAIVKEATDAARQNWNDIKQDYRERGARARMPQSQNIDRAVASRPSAKRFSQRTEINQEVYDPTVANTAERERIDNIPAWRGRTREDNIARRRNLRGEIDDSIQRRRQRRATNLVNSLPDQEVEATVGTQDIQNTEDAIGNARQKLRETETQAKNQEAYKHAEQQARQKRLDSYMQDESRTEVGRIRGNRDIPNTEDIIDLNRAREEIQAEQKARDAERARQRQANDSYGRDDIGEVQPTQVSYSNRDSAENPDDAIDLRQVIKAVKSGKIQETPKVAPKETTQSQNKVYGNSAEVVSDKQSPYQTKYRVVEADELNASHTMDGDNVFTNESYPKELQPRDRNRVEMSAQTVRMANSLSPADLMESRNANQGAPVIRSDGVVLNGNGRTMAIRRAYETGKGEGYKDAIVQNAEKLGLDADKVSKMRRPVLVREVAQDISDEDVRNLTSSTTGGARLGASEQAKIDAQKLSKEALDLSPEDEITDLTQAKSQDFVRAVIGDITANADERNSLVDAKGNIAQDGINRVKRALFARAYGDDGLISRMSESTDDNIRGVSNALLTAAPEIAKVQKSMEAGALHDYDLSAIPAAAKKLSSLRNEGKTVATFLKEQSLFGEETATPEAKEILRFFDRKKFAPNKIAQFLREIAKGIRNQGNPNQGSLFGAREPKPLLDIIKRAADNVENGGQADMFAEAERANETKGEEQNEAGKTEKTETKASKPAEKNTDKDAESGQVKEKVTPAEAAKRYNESNSIEGGADTRIINLVDDAKLTPQQKLLKDFAAKLGVPIQFFDNPDGRFHGAFADGITFLNVNSKKGLGGVFWHESFHWLKANNPELYAKLVDAAGITQAQRDAFLKRTGRKDLTTNEEIDEEILADQMEDVAKRTGLLQNIAGKNRGLVERVVQWLKDTMNKFIDTFRNPTGRLTTAQAKALAGEFGKIARSLKDADGNHIFRVNNRTGDIEVIGGRKAPDVSHGQGQTATQSLAIKYSIAPADNSNQSWGRRLKNWTAGLTGSKKSPDRIHQEMKQRLMDLSNMKIAAGHLPKGMQESVDEVARVIRTKKEYDWVKVLPHVGNSVAAQLGITQSVEMSNCIAKYLYDGVVDEQSAEGKEFIQAMRNNEEMRDKILATQEVFGRWREMSTVEKQIASIQFSKPKENLTLRERAGQFWREMRRQLFDAQAPIGYQVEHFEKTTGMKLADSLNPAVAFSRLRGTQGLALSMIDGGREEAAVLAEKFANINFDNWKSIAEILHMAGAFKSAQNYKEFATFVTANQILTLHKHNDNNRKKQAEIRQKISELKADLNLAGTKKERDRIEKSIERRERALSDLQDSIKELPEAWDTKEKCEKAISELSAKHGDKFEKAQKALVEYSNTLMAMRVDAGLMSTQRFNELLYVFPDYVPLHRIFDENSDLEGDSDKHMVGSGKDIIDPIQAIMDNTFDIVHRCEKNKAKQMLATLARFDGVGRIFEEVESGSNDGTIINFYEGGKRKRLQCADPALVKAVNNLAPAPMNWAMKLFRVSTLVLKGATTALSPAFMARNLFRDPQDAYVYSAKGGGNVFKDALRYMTPLFALKCTFDTLCGNNKTYEALINKLNMEVDKKLLAQYRIYGGSQSTFFDFDANVKADLFAKYTKGNWKRFASPKGVLRFLEKLGELSERGTRLQRFKQVKDNLKEQHGGINIYDDLVTAAFESRDLMDFARHGEAGHTWNTMAAFANPALQGIDKLIRTFDVNKLKKFGGTEETQKQWMSSVARLMIGSILPAIVLTVLHKDDDWYKDDLQPWEKDAYWIISEDFKIPKGADVATRFFSNLAEALVNSDNEPIKAKRILMPLYDGLPNLLPTAMAPVIECFFNKDMFKGTPIIPMRERYLSATPEKQYDSSNSNFAIWLGNKLGVSPRQIDHMIYGYTGNLGKGAMKVVDTGLHATGLSDKPVQPWTQAWIPVVGGFLREPYANSKIVRDYYAELDKQRSYVEAYKLDRKTDKNAKLDEDFDRKWYARLKAGEKAMGEFAKHERAILDNPKLTSEQVEEQRRKIQEKRIALLRRIFEYKRAQ